MRGLPDSHFVGFQCGMDELCFDDCIAHHTIGFGYTLNYPSARGPAPFSPQLDPSSPAPEAF